MHLPASLVYNLLLLLKLSFPLCCSSAGLQEASITGWNQIRDNLDEYSLLSNSTRVESLLECLASAVDAAADAATFSANDVERVCCVYRCQWGPFGCRKCRFASENFGQLIWVKPLLQHNRRVCWRTFQHRVDDSVLFNKSWTEYSEGFGQGEQSNFWLGLDALHQASKDGLRRVRWELNLWTGAPFWAENEHFVVAGQDELYRLDLGPLDSNRSTLGMCGLGHTGSPYNQQFTTYDSDNDKQNKSNCAIGYQSGWWFNRCFCFNPNGRYVDFEATEQGQTGGPAMAYTWPGSDYPFVLWYSHYRFECLITEFN